MTIEHANERLEYLLSHKYRNLEVVKVLRVGGKMDYVVARKGGGVICDIGFISRIIDIVIEPTHKKIDEIKDDGEKIVKEKNIKDKKTIVAITNKTKPNKSKATKSTKKLLN